MELDDSDGLYRFQDCPYCHAIGRPPDQVELVLASLTGDVTPELLAHARAEHAVCDDCSEPRIFQSKKKLKAHQRAAHGR